MFLGARGPSLDSAFPMESPLEPTRSASLAQGGLNESSLLLTPPLTSGAMLPGTSLLAQEAMASSRMSPGSALPLTKGFPGYP